MRSNTERTTGEILGIPHARDTSIADYVWLPIRFDGDRPIIDWREEWSPDEYEDA